MIPTFIILFREILEISIILSIILAATRGVAGRGRWIWAGIGGGVLGSALVAFFAGAISNAIEGMGQEVFNAGVLFVAVFMIGWTVVWMQTHAREMSQKIKQVGQAVHDGKLPLYALATVVSLSMWREGAEIVLFMTGILATTEESMLAIFAGGAAGTLCAATLGTLLYFGLIKISMRYMFATTSWLLILLACGMSAQAAGYLVAADMLPALAHQVWDSSWLLSQDSIAGKILHAMLGYTERPSGIQLLFYIGTFIVISTLLKLTQRKPAVNKTALQTAAIVIAVCAIAAPAHALDVDSPYVEKGIMEVEMKNRVDFDSRSSEDRFRQHEVGVGYGVTNWWGIEIGGEWERNPGSGYQFTATEIENVFQLTDPGEYWLDAGLEAKYEISHESGGADKVELFALLAKQTNQFTHVANIGIEQEVAESSRNRNPELAAKWMTRYNWKPMINPGIEYYGEYGEMSDPSDYDDQKHRLGPVLYGKLGHGFKYELGWLFGLSKATEDHAVKFNIEYEFPVGF